MLSSSQYTELKIQMDYDCAAKTATYDENQLKLDKKEGAK